MRPEAVAEPLTARERGTIVPLILGYCIVVAIFVGAAIVSPSRAARIVFGVLAAALVLVALGVIVWIVLAVWSDLARGGPEL